MLEKIKKIREITGAGIVEIKKALSEVGGDEQKALDILKKRGQERAFKKAQKATEEGLIASYIHSNRKVGAMVKLLCETDFVARNEEFRELAMDIAMHITAMDPEFLNPEDVPGDLVRKKREIWIDELKAAGKPENIFESILSGKEKKMREELSLMSQPFVKSPDQTVSDLIADKIGKIGENIKITEFKRMSL